MGADGSCYSHGMVAPPKDVEAPSVPGTARFGEWFRHVREDLIRAPQQVLTAAGGPSDSTISRIENGEGPVSIESLRKCALAITSLGGHALGDPDTYGPAASGAGLFAAVAASFAADTAEANEERSAAIRASDVGLRELGPQTRLVVGVTLDSTYELVTASALRYAPVPSQGSELVDGELGGRSQLSGLLQIAARYPGITLAPEDPPVGLAASISFTDAGRVVHKGIQGCFDPIKSITTLDAAEQRAEILKKTTLNRVHTRTLGWVILLANAVGVKEDISPYIAWMRYDEYKSVWEQAYAELRAQLSKPIAALDELVSHCRQVMVAWSGVDPDRPIDVGFRIGANGKIHWTSAPDWELAEPPSTRNGDLWLYNGLGGYSEILHEYGIGHIHLSRDGLTEPGQDGPEYIWAANPANPQYALLFSSTSGWLPVQIY